MKWTRTLTGFRVTQLAALALMSATNGFCTITLNTSAAYLREANGDAMRVTGLVLLVASKSDGTFGSPTPDAFVSGDDQVIARWDLSSWNTPGSLIVSTGPVALGNGWDAGDPLQLYWFPTLTLASTKPAAGAPYGQYRADAIIDGSDPWITPADGATISLSFLTTDAGGSVNPPVAGDASFVVGGIAAPVILSLAMTNATNVVMTWSAVSNRTYRVEYQSGFGAAWSQLAPDVTATSNTATAVDDFSGQGQRYYRIQLLP